MSVLDPVTLEYERNQFDPPPAAELMRRLATEGPPPADSPKYVYDDSIILAVNVALATQRPLLVAGSPGSGKTTLAKHIAHTKGWRYLEKVVTSKTQVDDLIMEFDALKRLNDAAIPKQSLLPDAAYVNPGVLWWAFDPDSATWRGTTKEELSASELKRFQPAKDPSQIGSGDDVVVLLDEIDKADPDVPNDILEPLDRRSFRLRSGKPIEAKGQILMVITTNGERELPQAFIRRCVSLTLGEVTVPRLVQIAQLHFGLDDPDRLFEHVAELIERLGRHARDNGLREPSTAEFVDTIRACRKLEARADTADRIAGLALAKDAALLDVLFPNERHA